ncbi:hypothetical protein G6F42_014446 [Rhizopus arrhizus]|nr:hypothetical protein G6F42_014446 [Rhizopus arrhizus]
MPYRRQEYELMAKRFILPQNVALVALNIMLIFSNQLLFTSTSVSRFWHSWLHIEYIKISSDLLFSRCHSSSIHYQSVQRTNSFQHFWQRSDVYFLCILPAILPAPSTKSKPAVSAMDSDYPAHWIHPHRCSSNPLAARAQNGTYVVRHENGAFVSYHPPYGNAMGRLQDDIMYLQRLERQEEERRMAMEFERRARMFDDMERRGVQFASYVYYT